MPHRLAIRPALAALCLAPLTALSALGQDVVADWDVLEAQRYAECLQRTIDEPDTAYELGLAWLYEAGGLPAAHCTAAALMALGQNAEGATRLEEAAITPLPIEDIVRAELLAQAAAGWMIAERPDDARRALTSALSFQPGDAQLLIDRAVAAAVTEDYPAAIDDLTLALSSSPVNILALRLRAEAWLELDRIDQAAADVERALAVDPEDIETLLVRGRVRQRQQGLVSSGG